MKYRNLRIAWSVAVALAFILEPGFEPGYDSLRGPTGFSKFRMEHELLVLGVAFLLAAAPWVPTRFSLRTLLIATTLVAVVLGLIVWAAN